MMTVSRFFRIALSLVVLLGPCIGSFAFTTLTNVKHSLYQKKASFPNHKNEVPSVRQANIVKLGFGSSDDDNGMEKKKETTWDRITGPKLFKTVTNWQGIHSVPLVPLRIITGLLMIHHGSEGGVGPANVGTPEFQGFIDYIITPYFSFLPGSPELWSALHDYAEFYGGIFFALGFLTRPAALTLLGTMLSAVYFHLSANGLQGFPLGHVSNYSYDFEEPLLYALIFLMFWFNGAGPLSIDSIIYKNISTEDDELK